MLEEAKQAAAMQGVRDSIGLFADLLEESDAPISAVAEQSALSTYRKILQIVNPGEQYVPSVGSNEDGDVKLEWRGVERRLILWFSVDDGSITVRRLIHHAGAKFPECEVEFRAADEVVLDSWRWLIEGQR
jgi:hypothetical protein